MKTTSKELLSLYSRLCSNEFKEMDTENRRGFIRQIINKLCETNDLPLLHEITFNNINDGNGYFNARNDLININLDDLSQSDQYPFNVLDAIIHETNHHAQYHASNNRFVKLGLENPLSADDKDYALQIHEMKTYDHTTKQLYKIAKDLKDNKLEEYAQKREQEVANMRNIKQIPEKLMPLYAVVRQPAIIKKQIDSAKFNSKYEKELVQYNSANIVNKTVVHIDVKLDSGFNKDCFLEIKENDDYFEANIQHNTNNIAGNSILRIHAKNNSAVMLIDNLDDVKITSATIETAKTIIHYYNNRYNKKLQSVNIVFDGLVAQKDVDSLYNSVGSDRLDSIVRVSICNVDTAKLNTLSKKIQEAKQKEIFGFRIDGKRIDTYNKMSDEMCMLKIKDILQEGDKILINSFKEYNDKIIFTLTEDMKTEIPKYYNKRTCDWNNFDMHDLLLDAGIIEFAGASSTPPIPIPTLEEKLEDASIKTKTIDKSENSVQKQTNENNLDDLNDIR